MESQYDSRGFLVKVQSKFAYGKDVTLTKFNGATYLHIFDNSKCWDKHTKTYDKSKGKTISLKWMDAVALKDSLLQFEHFVRRIEIEEHMGVPVSQQENDLQESLEDSLANRESGQTQLLDITPEPYLLAKQGGGGESSSKIQGGQKIKTVAARRFQPY